jgi:hypothetical protein
MSIHGFGRMKVHYDNLPQRLRQGFHLKLIDLSNTMNSREISSTIYGLGKMNAKLWHDDPTYSSPSLTLQDNVNSTLPLTTESSTGNIDNDELKYMARTALEQAILSQYKHFNSQALSNTLWGLMNNDCSWKSLPIAIQNALQFVAAREMGKMDEQQLANSVYAMGKLGLRYKL